MPTDYLAVDDYDNTVVLPSDGDKRKAASVNPAFMRIANNVRNVKDGAAFKALTTFITGAWTFSNILSITGVLKAFGRLALKGPTTLSNNLSNQVVDPADGPLFLLRTPINSLGPRYLKLKMAGNNDGEIAIFSVLDLDVSTGSPGSGFADTEFYDLREDSGGATSIVRFEEGHPTDFPLNQRTMTGCVMRYSATDSHWHYVAGWGFVRPGPSHP